MKAKNRFSCTTILRTYVICRIKHVSGLDTVKVYYFPLFEWHIRYDIAEWRGTVTTIMEKVQIHQKRTISCPTGQRNIFVKQCIRDHMYNSQYTGIYISTTQDVPRTLACHLTIIPAIWATKTSRAVVLQVPSQLTLWFQESLTVHKLNS